MVPTANLSHLPVAFRATVDNCIHHFVSADRGQVQRHNDKTFDARATLFARWCVRNRLSEHDLRRLDDNGLVILLGTYLFQVKQGDNQKRKLDLASDTVRNYWASAHRFLEWVLGRSIDMNDPQSNSTHNGASILSWRDKFKIGNGSNGRPLRRNRILWKCLLH